MRAPMGFKSSGDHLVNITDAWLNEVPGLRKEVDDILMQAEDSKEMVERLRTFFKICEKHGMWLSRPKIQIDPRKCTPNIRGMMSTQVSYIWTEGHQEEFDNIKRI